jgi:hypothetical protein
MTELCELAIKWTTDKALFYTPFYHELLKDRRDIKKVLEFGIGYPEAMLDSLSRMNQSRYIIGASLFMWQEYFPEAQIYAFDNKPEIFINEGRIKSFYCDQSGKESFKEAINNIGGDFDLIIEDGSHVREHQILSMQMLMPLLKDDGIYIMEDIGKPYEELISQIPYPRELKKFSRTDLPDGQNTAAIVIIRKTRCP